MKSCERSEVCSFFNNKLGNMPSIASTLKKKYCLTSKDDCARYMIHVKLREGLTPPDEATLLAIDRQMHNLYPNDSERARLIIDMLVQH